MDERVYWITHENKKILIGDVSNLKEKEYLQEVDVPCLIDFPLS